MEYPAKSYQGGSGEGHLLGIYFSDWVSTASLPLVTFTLQLGLKTELQIMLSFYKPHQTVTATEEQKTSTKLTLDWDKSRAGLRLLVVC